MAFRDAAPRHAFSIPHALRFLVPASLLMGGLAQSVLCETARPLVQPPDSQETNNVSTARKALTKAVDSLAAYGALTLKATSVSSVFWHYPGKDTADARILDDLGSLGAALRGMAATQLVTFYRASAPELRRLDSLLNSCGVSATSVISEAVVYGSRKLMPLDDVRLGSLFLMLGHVRDVAMAKSGSDSVTIEREYVGAYMTAAGPRFRTAVREWCLGKAPLSNDALLVLFINVSGVKDQSRSRLLFPR